MKLLIINSVCGIRSTGRICTDIATEYEEKGYEVKIAYGRETVPKEFQRFAIRIGNEFTVRINALSCRLFDNDGFAAKQQTKKFLKWAEEFNPDELWLHNLHGYYINVEMLFNWIKSRPNMKVKWTLHDCWSFTGHCTHFEYVGCYRWKKQCCNCPQLNEYPKSVLFDNSEKNFLLKKNAFNDISNLSFITPSKWLKDLVKSSFLSKYDVCVMYNTIDLESFKPTTSNFRERYNLNDKFIVLGVASSWNNRKGLDDYVKLANILDDRYKVVLVGLSRKQIKQLPNNILKLGSTNNKKSLAEIYTAADVLVNLTREDNFPTVNLEARACGTQVITYNTGGSSESAGADAIIVENKNERTVADILTKIRT